MRGAKIPRGCRLRPVRGAVAAVAASLAVLLTAAAPFVRYRREAPEALVLPGRHARGPAQHLTWRRHIGRHRTPLRATEGESPSEADWREFRARLVIQEQREEARSPARETSTSGGQRERPSAANPSESDGGWAYATPLIEQGSLLLSAPGDHFAINQQYFHKTVIFIIEHTPKFTIGVILNRPTAFNTGDLGGILPVTDKWNVWCGGDCHGLNSRGDGHVEYCCLHTLGRLPNSTEIIKGVYTIALTSAQELVAAGKADKDDFLLLVGYCGWGPLQLQGELDRGDTWQLAAADRAVLLGMLKDQQASLTRRLEAATSQPSAAAGQPVLTAAEVGDGIAEWARLYKALGPKFAAQLDEEVKDPANGHTDEMLKRWINRCLIPPRFQVEPRPSSSERPLRLQAGTILRGSPTAWLLGKPAERPGLDSVLAQGIPAQCLHKSVLYLVRDYPGGKSEPVLLVLLNGPQVAETDSAEGVFFGGPSGGEVYELKGEIPFRFRGLLIMMPDSLDDLVQLGALEVAEDADITEVLSVPPRLRWETVGGRLERLSDAAEASLGDVQRRLWYKRFLGLDLTDED